MDGEDVKFKADTEGPDYDEYIKTYRRRSQEIKSYQCLLMNAPSEDSLGQQEMMNFCHQAFPPDLFDAAAVEELRMCQEVSRPGDVVQFIQDFFRRRDGITAKRALHALLVFFGHGTKQGFCVGEEDHMPLDDIISTVKNEWLEALKRDPECLPVRVKIIFAHCYSHLHPEFDKGNKIEKFEVVSLTTEKHPLAYSVKNAYYVMQLNKYVDEHLGPEIRRQLETRRRNSGRIEDAQPGDSGYFPG